MVDEKGLQNNATLAEIDALRQQVEELTAEIQRLRPLPPPPPRRKPQVNITLSKDLDTALEAVRGKKSRAEWCLDVIKPALWEAFASQK